MLDTANLTVESDDVFPDDENSSVFLFANVLLTQQVRNTYVDSVKCRLVWLV